MEEGVLLKAVELNARGDQVQIRRSQLNGTPRIDIRRWYLDDSEVMRPTRKGISLPQDKLATVVVALSEVLASDN
jgi:hypothetical protein